jgi:hypothetical protein
MKAERYSSISLLYFIKLPLDEFILAADCN